MDICPTHYMHRTTDKEMASTYFTSSLYPARAIPRDADREKRRRTLTFFMGSVIPNGIEPEAYAEYRRCFSDPATIHAACEDYRAAASIDLEHDEADMNQKIACPLLVLWARKGLVGKKYHSVDLAGAGNPGLRQSSTRRALAPRGMSERNAGGDRAVSAG